MADGDCSHETKRRLLLGEKALTNLDSILKSRDITLPTKVHVAKAMFFPAVMYGCVSWTIKAECQRIDDFELWCWRRHMRVPWTGRISNQSILTEISPEYSLEGLMLKLKLQYFVHLMWRADSFRKTLVLGKIEGGTEGDDRGWVVGWHYRLNGVNSGYWWWTGRPSALQSMGAQSQTRLSNWTELNRSLCESSFYDLVKSGLFHLDYAEFLILVTGIVARRRDGWTLGKANIFLQNIYSNWGLHMHSKLCYVRWAVGGACVWELCVWGGGRLSSSLLISPVSPHVP